MPLRSLYLSNQDIENALIFGAAGRLSLQQCPYECPDTSFEYTTNSDVLKPAVVNPHEPPSKETLKNIKQRDQTARPTPVPNLDHVQPFLSAPDFVERPRSEIYALLASQHIRNPYPYPGNVDLLPSYSSEPPESASLINLRKQVKHALANAWKYDPNRCSVKTAFKIARDLADTPNHGLTDEEYRWATGGKLKTAKKARGAAQVDFEQARKTYEWMKKSDEDDEALSLDGTNLDQKLDEFYGRDGTDLRPIDNDSDDEGFCEPDAIATTTISLPDKSLMEEGVTPGGIFQDSGISMDEGYAEYSLAHSLPTTAREITGTVPNDWPTFDADVAPLRLPKKKGRWLGLIGDQKQCEWPGRRQGPYDLHGLHSWICASKSDHVEILDDSEASNSDSQDMAGSFTPQPVKRKVSVIRDVEAAVGQGVEATGARTTAALAVTEVRDTDQMVDAPTVDTPHQNPRSAEVKSSIESVKCAQEVSKAMEGKGDEKPSEATPQILGQEQPQIFRGNTVNQRNIKIPEQSHIIVASDKGAENNGASVGAAPSVSEERSQHFPGSIENGSDNEPFVNAPYMIRGVPQINIDANAHARRSIPTTTFATPVNRQIRQLQQVQVDTPATPATVNINLTPEYDSDMDADDASGGSLGVGMPNSPTDNTHKGQSALGRYVQETSDHPSLARQSSSTVSLGGSESEEVSLIPTQEEPSQPEGHAGFSKGVEFNQKKTGAVVTLSPPKASGETASSSKTAPIPATPANGKDSASFRPTTPFQLGTPAHPESDTPRTPTPAPKTSRPKGKSVMNVFKSPKLGSRSPERVNRNHEIVAPTTPAAGAGAQHRGSSFGGQGLLFQKARRNERDTKNVLNSLKLSPQRGSGSGSGTSERDSQEDYEDELAGEKNIKVYKGGKWVQETPSMMGSRIDLGANGGRKVAQAVVVPSVRPRDENEQTQFEDLQIGEPRKKKVKRSVRAAGGADVPDVEPFFEH